MGNGSDRRDAMGQEGSGGWVGRLWGLVELAYQCAHIWAVGGVSRQLSATIT